jgi:hypothetical protein
MLRTGWLRTELISQQEQDVFISSRASTLALRQTHPPIQQVPGALSPMVRQPTQDGDHSPPSGTQIKHAWSRDSTISYGYMVSKQAIWWVTSQQQCTAASVCMLIHMRLLTPDTYKQHMFTQYKANTNCNLKTKSTNTFTSHNTCHVDRWMVSYCSTILPYSYEVL